MSTSWNKKEREKKKQQQKKEKAEKKLQRKESSQNKSFDDMIAYLDENGNLTSTPPDPSRKQEYKLEDIEIGVPAGRNDMEPEIHKGTVTFFNESKGYGFIRDHATNESIFVHANNLLEPVADRDVVEFDIESGPRGHYAVRVKRSAA